MQKKIFLFLTFLSFLLLPASVFAQQTGVGVAITVPVLTKDAQDGDIVSTVPNGYVVSKTENDTGQYGVISDAPQVSLENKSMPNGRLVMTEGKAYVRVSGKNGAIKPGDPITSSTTSGVGVKATNVGIIIGFALEGYSPKSPTDVSKILVAVHVQENTNISNIGEKNLLTILRLAISSPVLSPLSSLRYVLAAVIAGGSFVFAFRFFGKIAANSIEAFGRNPLASRMIQLGVLFNVALTIVMMAAGLLLAYFILIL